MPRAQPKKVPMEERRQAVNEFWDVIAALKSSTEIENFFKNLLSETEVLMLARRIRIAKLLLEGKGYDEIKNAMGTSYATIASVHNWLQSDLEKDKKIIEKIEKKYKHLIKEGGVKGKSAPFSFEWLKNRYPLPFLLFHLMDHFDGQKKK